MNDDEFQKALAFGQIGAQKIAAWLERHRYAVVGTGKQNDERYKGPQITSAEADMVAPDLLAIRGDDTKWIEAKHKSVFSWYRIGRCWVTGIDQRHWDHYQKVAARCPWPLWILFLHRIAKPSQSDLNHGCPMNCPTGLFGQETKRLQQTINHTSDRWAKGMVYWRSDKLVRLATLEEMSDAS